ncbi:hypothetical protein BTN49_0637 [Candidatus Enterovibrio escicola]|uniref:Uncharacterized protein n=1 Tax=Candidatus Enterovibrio escicola TaxID=1927127 RepID=A0A2A5T6B3_9GAMM|nr:hypothetical protein BTN49_0637 [Candidatus Enterovibrio escacola]
MDAQVFVGRLVQYILPKGFQRVRYYALQVTARAAGDLVDAMISYTKRISYVEFFEEVAGRNPLKCVFCGKGMELVRFSYPKNGVFLDLFVSDSG